jgi:CBS domain-containing protein
MGDSGEVPPEVLDDVIDLLVSCPAFVGVSRDALAALANDAEIGYVASVEEPVMPAFVVQRGGVLIRDSENRTLDMVAEGEFCAPEADEVLDPVEPSLVVWLPSRAIDLAWSAPPTQLQHVVGQPVRSRIDLQTASVVTVMRSPVHTAEPDETCAAVAQRMTQERISSIVIVDGDRIGIATDRDLRSRLIGEGRSAETPIGQIATFPVRTISARTPVFEALIEMLASGIHHLPVMEDGRLIGMVSSNDVLDLGTRSPLFLRAALDRAEDVAGVASVVNDLPAAVDALLAAGTTAGDVGRVIATVTDRVQSRLLTLAFAELGAPPSEYGWLAFGSQARREQTLHSDQDHGLLLPDGIDPPVHEWWRALAEWMVAALERCGYERCNGGVMASNEAWRHEAAGWRRLFTDWIDRPSEAHVLQTTIAFDLRTVSGQLHVRELLAPTIARAAERGIFLGRLARDATRHRPPLGFFGRFAVERSGEHAGSFDIKAGVMLPIADIGRLYALASRRSEISTDDRLAAAAGAGLLSHDLAETLRAGYELAMALRLRRHLEQHREGNNLDNWLDPDELAPLARGQLRETFKAIRTAQQNVEARYHTGMLG